MQAPRNAASRADSRGFTKTFWNPAVPFEMQREN